MFPGSNWFKLVWGGLICVVLANPTPSGPVKVSGDCRLGGEYNYLLT